MCACVCMCLSLFIMFHYGKIFKLIIESVGNKKKRKEDKFIHILSCRNGIFNILLCCFLVTVICTNLFIFWSHNHSVCNFCVLFSLCTFILKCQSSSFYPPPKGLQWGHALQSHTLSLTYYVSCWEYIKSLPSLSGLLIPLQSLA